MHPGWNTERFFGALSLESTLQQRKTHGGKWKFSLCISPPSSLPSTAPGTPRGHQLGDLPGSSGPFGRRDGAGCSAVSPRVLSLLWRARPLCRRVAVGWQGPPAPPGGAGHARRSPLFVGSLAAFARFIASGSQPRSAVRPVSLPSPSQHPGGEFGKHPWRVQVICGIRVCSPCSR